MGGGLSRLGTRKGEPAQQDGGQPGAAPSHAAQSPTTSDPAASLREGSRAAAGLAFLSEQSSAEVLSSLRPADVQTVSAAPEGQGPPHADEEGEIYDDNDEYDLFDIERIEAEYRAARARAIFSAGAAARCVRLDDLRNQAEKTIKREAEASSWRQQLESRVIMLQAKLLEQHIILKWGPTSLQTGRLDKAAVVQLQQGIKELDETIRGLETLSRLNTPREHEGGSQEKQRVELKSGHRGIGPWPLPSTRPGVVPPKSFARSRPWSWKGRRVTAQKVQRVISECISSWSPLVTQVASLPGESSVRDHFATYLDTPRLEIPEPTSAVSLGDEKQTHEEDIVNDILQSDIQEDAEIRDETELEGSPEAETDQKEEEPALGEAGELAAAGEARESAAVGETGESTASVPTGESAATLDDQGGEESAAEEQQMEMTVDLGKADSLSEPHARSPVSLQQSYQEEEPAEVIHPVWAPSSRSLELSETLGEDVLRVRSRRASLVGGTGPERRKSKALKESKIRLPRILGLDTFQNAFEMRCNLSLAADCIEENENLAHDLRQMVVAIRPKHTRKRLVAAIKNVQRVNSFRLLLKSDDIPEDAEDENGKEEETKKTNAHAFDTIADQILSMQDELTDMEATFRSCEHCAGHFTRTVDRRGPPPQEPEKSALQKDLENLANFAANEIQPTVREAVSAAVTASYSMADADQGLVSQSVLAQLNDHPHQFYSTKVRKILELPAELESEVTIKRSKARADFIVNLKKELVSYQSVVGTETPADVYELETLRKKAFDKVRKTRQQCQKMKDQLASTLKIQGLWRGVTCRESFRKRGIHISSPLEEHARKNLLPALKEAFGSEVAIRRESDYEGVEKKIFAGMVNAQGAADGWGCAVFPQSDLKKRTNYMGEFVDGLMHGVGVLVFQQGARYEGQFQRDVPHGYGVEYYTSGAIYQGQFQNDLRHGFGIYTFTSGISYGGTWEMGFQHGEGVEISILSPVDPIRPKSPLLKTLNELSASQNDFMEAGERAMEKARRKVQEGDADGSKWAVKESMKWMGKAAAASEDLRACLQGQRSTGRKLVRYFHGRKIEKKVIDPNAIADKILEGGWVELAVDAATFDSRHREQPGAVARLPGEGTMHIQPYGSENEASEETGGSHSPPADEKYDADEGLLVEKVETARNLIDTLLAQDLENFERDEVMEVHELLESLLPSLEKLKIKSRHLADEETQLRHAWARVVSRLDDDADAGSKRLSGMVSPSQATTSMDTSSMHTMNMALLLPALEEDLSDSKEMLFRKVIGQVAGIASHHVRIKPMPNPKARSGKTIDVTISASSFEKMNHINSILEHSAMNAALKEAELPAAIIVSRSGRKQLTPIDVFFQKFPDAANGPLQPGQPALVVADADAEKPWSLYQIQIQTEDNDVWWYQSEALRPGHPSVKERMRREAERYQLDMQQRELDEMRIEEIMIHVSDELSTTLHHADLAKDGGAQTAATCAELIQAMQRMPTLEAVEPKTGDGADFLRALRKHRELEDMENQEEKSQHQLLQAKSLSVLGRLERVIEVRQLGAKSGMLIPVGYDRIEHMLLQGLLLPEEEGAPDVSLSPSECRTLFNACVADVDGKCSLRELLRGLTDLGNQDPGSARKEDDSLRVTFEGFADMSCNGALSRSQKHDTFNLVAGGGEAPTGKTGWLEAVALTETVADP